MAFCSKCGTKLDDNVQFCPSCGTPTAGVVQVQPKSVTMGQVKKCPACGEPIESFQTRCTNCGHELNDIKASEKVQEFFQKMEEFANFEYSRNVQKEREAAWEDTNGTHGKKNIDAGTVLLWIFFFWIMWVPLIFRKAKGPYATGLAVCGVIAIFSLMVIYGSLNPTESASVTVDEQSSEVTADNGSTQDSGISLPATIVILIFSLASMGVIFIIMKPKWTPEDKRKQELIDHFVVPSSRADLIEFVRIATDYIKPINSFLKLFSLKVKYQVAWNHVWADKCNQVYKSARIAMKDDPNGLKIISELITEAGLATANTRN